MSSAAIWLDKRFPDVGSMPVQERMIFVMRTAFCSNTPLHKHFVESIVPPSRLDPKSSKQNMSHLLDGFCDAHCIL